MKKLLLLLLLLNTASTIGYSQGKTGPTTTTASRQPSDYTTFIHFDGFSNKQPSSNRMIIQGVMETDINAILKLTADAPKITEHDKGHLDYQVDKFIPRSPILLGVKLTGVYRADNPYYHLTSLSKQYVGYKLFDKDTTEALAMGINQDNVNDYRYRVVANDSAVLVPWSVPLLQQKHGAKKPYGYFGSYNSPGKEILVEVINIKDQSIRDGVIFNWNNRSKPVISQVRIAPQKTSWSEAMLSAFDVSDVTRNHGYATKFDNGVPLDLHFPLESVRNMTIRFAPHPTVSYEVYWIDKQDPDSSNNLIGTNIRDEDFIFDNQYFARAGKFSLIISPTNSLNKQQGLRFNFEVTAPTVLKTSFSFVQLLPYLILILIIGVGYYLINRRRLKKARQQKELANLKLSAVRSQLNPHFMFNALTSIQNLMNQHDTEGANHYLSKFAGLTRRVLNSSGNELISLEDEIAIVTDYLQMEQLRFGFEYTIDVDATINKANTEIPAMLLQPFIENAAKHGVSAMQKSGKITVAIVKQNKDLVMIITDNGPGFKNTDNATNAFGLRLSKERIALLNSVYKGQPIYLKVDSDDKGAKVTITLTNWV